MSMPGLIPEPQIEIAIIVSTTPDSGQARSELVGADILVAIGVTRAITGLGGAFERERWSPRF